MELLGRLKGQHDGMGSLEDAVISEDVGILWRPPGGNPPIYRRESSKSAP